MIVDQILQLMDCVENVVGGVARKIVRFAELLSLSIFFTVSAELTDEIAIAIFAGALNFITGLYVAHNIMKPLVRSVSVRDFEESNLVFILNLLIILTIFLSASAGVYFLTVVTSDALAGIVGIESDGG